MSEPTIWGCEEGHVDDHHLTDGGVCPTCAGEGMVVRDGEDQLRPDSPTCPACEGDGRATNVLCSRCGGTCTPFASVELLVREYIERLRVNVGLLAENTQLKKKLREGGDASAAARRDEPESKQSTVVARRGAGESGSPPSTSDPAEGLPPVLAAALQDHSLIVTQDASLFKLIADWTEAPSNTVSADPRYIEPRYTLPELADLLTSDEALREFDRVLGEIYNEDEEPCPDDYRRALQAAISTAASIKGEGQ